MRQKDERLVIRINAKTKKEIFELAKKQGKSTSKLLNELIIRHIEMNYKLLMEQSNCGRQ